MFFGVLADLVLIAHLSFAMFTVFGGLLVLRRPYLLWFHLACIFWGVFVQWANWACPLTPLENLLRQMSGQTGYRGGFVEHYVSLVLYPENLTIELRYVLGILLIVINILIYGFIFLRRRQIKFAKSG